jgi:3-oxoacyl-[acyl-carrier protein] reductase
LELAAFGFRVAGIAPGLTNTPILSRVSPDALAEMTATIPLGRIAEPYEIWQAARFIIECDYFTGSIIDVDGGARF